MCAGIGIPHLDVVFFMSAGEYASIGTECHAENTSCVTAKRILVFTSMCIPESDSTVAASGGNGISIWAESDTLDTSGMPYECFFLCVFYVP